MPRFTSFFAALFAVSACAMAQTSLSPRTLKPLAKVDERFVSYNVEAVEVTGGRFWKPYNAETDAKLAASAKAKPDNNRPAGIDPGLLQYRAPIDLSSPKLRKLAAALGSAYIRVSGTWRNTTYFQDDDAAALQKPPEGFNGVMTRAQWKGVVDFSKATKASIVTSVAISAGTRDPQGAWTPEQARALFHYTRQIGGVIVATEFMNEPTLPSVGGAPANYDAAAFARDIKSFRALLTSVSPQTLLLGPGSIGEGQPMIAGTTDALPIAIALKTTDIMKATGPAFDAFSYHFYTTVSRRCIAAMGLPELTAKQTLSPGWFARNLQAYSYYAGLRDTYLPGKEMWLTETGEAACGGDKLAATFQDSFRYLDQLGSLAQKGVKTVMQNTLASSDYGLLDEETFDPRPNYWAALLWKQTMDTTVLDPGMQSDSTLRIYSQCSKGGKGGVTVLAINTDESNEKSLQLPLAGTRYTLSATELSSRQVLLNGAPLKAGADGSIPVMKGQPIRPGELKLPPLSINFLSLPAAGNPACR